MIINGQEGQVVSNGSSWQEGINMVEKQIGIVQWYDRRLGVGGIKLNHGDKLNAHLFPRFPKRANQRSKATEVRVQGIDIVLEEDKPNYLVHGDKVRFINQLGEAKLVEIIELSPSRDARGGPSSGRRRWKTYPYHGTFTRGVSSRRK